MLLIVKTIFLCEFAFFVFLRSVKIFTFHSSPLTVSLENEKDLCTTRPKLFSI